MTERILELWDDTTGRHYYYNTSNETSEWKRPKGMPARRSAEPLPDGWVRGWDTAAASLFRFNPATQESVYDVASPVASQGSPGSPVGVTPTSARFAQRFTSTRYTDSSELYATTPSQFVLYSREYGEGEGKGEEGEALDADTVFPSPRHRPPALPAVDVRRSSDVALSFGLTPVPRSASPSASASLSPKVTLTAFGDHWGDVFGKGPSHLPLPPHTPTPDRTPSDVPPYATPLPPAPAPTHAPPDRRLSADGQWEAQVDPVSHRRYYFHYPTSLSTWTPPEGVEFLPSSSTWRHMAPGSMVPKPPAVVDAARNVLHSTFGEWPPKHTSLQHLMKQMSVDSGSPSSTGSSPRRRSSMRAKQTSLPPHVTAKLSVQLASRAEDVEHIRGSECLSKRVVADGLSLRRLQKAEGGPESDVSTDEAPTPPDTQ